MKALKSRDPRIVSRFREYCEVRRTMEETHLNWRVTPDPGWRCTPRANEFAPKRCGHGFVDGVGEGGLTGVPERENYQPIVMLMKLATVLFLVSQVVVAIVFELSWIADDSRSPSWFALRDNNGWIHARRSSDSRSRRRSLGRRIGHTRQTENHRLRARTSCFDRVVHGPSHLFCNVGVLGNRPAAAGYRWDDCPVRSILGCCCS
jgi:hypothetical protein